VARKTRETMLVCEAAGFDVMIVETVGVGQSETTVASMVDFFLVLMLAGAGDELQGIKKGVLELADAVAINKADGDNIEKAEKARRSYEMALHLLNPASPTWSPPVLACSALTLAGVDTLWETILDYRKRLSATGELEEKRRRQALAWMWSRIEDGLKERFFGNHTVKVLPALCVDRRVIGVGRIGQIDLGSGDVQEAPGTILDQGLRLSPIDHIVGRRHNIVRTTGHRSQTTKRFDQGHTSSWKMACALVSRRIGTCICAF